MSVEVQIPTALKQYADNLEKIELEGSTIGVVLSNLVERCPGLKVHLFNEEAQHLGVTAMR